MLQRPLRYATSHSALNRVASDADFSSVHTLTGSFLLRIATMLFMERPLRPRFGAVVSDTSADETGPAWHET